VNLYLSHLASAVLAPCACAPEPRSLSCRRTVLTPRSLFFRQSAWPLLNPSPSSSAAVAALDGDQAFSK
jgi:hypothetical protein